MRRALQLKKKMSTPSHFFSYSVELLENKARPDRCGRIVGFQTSDLTKVAPNVGKVVPGAKRASAGFSGQMSVRKLTYLSTPVSRILTVFVVLRFFQGGDRPACQFADGRWGVSLSMYPWFNPSTDFVDHGASELD